MSTPPLPEGFVLDSRDGIPPLPEGFVLGGSSPPPATAAKPWERYAPAAVAESPAAVKASPPAADEPMGFWEAMGDRFEAGVMRPIGGAQQMLGEGLDQMLVGPRMISQLFEAADAPEAAADMLTVNDAGLDFAQQGADIARIAGEVSQFAQDARGVARPESFMDALTNPASTAEYYGGIVAESLPAMLAAMATRNPNLAAGVSGVSSGTSQFADARADGQDFLGAMREAMATGMTEAALSQSPFEEAFSGKPLASRVARTTAAEGGTEAITGPGQLAMENELRGKEQSPEDTLAALIDSLVVGTAIGPMEGVLGGGGEPDAPRSPPPTDPTGPAQPPPAPESIGVPPEATDDLNAMLEAAGVVDPQQPAPALEPKQPPEQPAAEPQTVESLDPDERARARFEGRLSEIGKDLPPETLERVRGMFEAPARDRVTNLHRGEEMRGTLETAHAQSAKTPAVYVEADLTNLGGLNAKLGNSGADPYIRRMADILSEELASVGTAVGHRKGGDEMGFIVQGTTQQDVDAAMVRARERFIAEMNAAGFADLKHKKDGGAPGVGIHFGTADILPDVPISDTVSKADRLVEDRKKGVVGYGLNEQNVPDGAGRPVARNAGEVPVRGTGAAAGAEGSAAAAVSGILRRPESGRAVPEREDAASQSADQYPDGIDPWTGEPYAADDRGSAPAGRDRPRKAAPGEARNADGHGQNPSGKSSRVSRPRQYLTGLKDEGLNWEAFRRQYGLDPVLYRGGKGAKRSGMIPGLFRRDGGMMPDDLRGRMIEDGWLLPDPENAPPVSGLDDVYDFILKGLNNEEGFALGDDAEIDAQTRAEIERRRQEEEGQEFSGEPGDDVPFQRRDGDLFGAPTSRELTDAARRAKDDQRNGRTGSGRTDMMSGPGELFAGPRPQQEDLTRVAQAEQTDASRRLERQFDNWLQSEGREDEQFRAREIPKAALPDALRRALRALEAATGKSIHVIRNLTPEVETFNGLTFRDGFIYIDEKADMPATLVASHEFVHELEGSDPDLYQELADEVQRQGNLPAWIERMADEGNTTDPRGALAELVADATADAMTDPAFLDRMAKESPTLFRRVATAFREFLDSLLGRIPNRGTNAYLQDVEAFRDKLIDVLRRYEAGKRGDGDEGSEPRFQRRTRLEAPAGDGGGGGGFSVPEQFDARDFDFAPPGSKKGIVQRTTDDLKDSVKALQDVLTKGPKNPESIRRRLNDTRAAIFDSVMSRARALEKRNPNAKSLRKLFNMAMAAPGDSRFVGETINDAIASRFSIFTNRVRNILENNGLGKLTDKQNDQLRAAMLGTLKNPPAAIGKAAQQLRNIMNTQREDLLATGVDVGEVQDVGYLTRMYDDAAILTNESGFLDAARKLYKDHEFALEMGKDGRAILYSDRDHLARFLAAARRAATSDKHVASRLAGIKSKIQEYRKSRKDAPGNAAIWEPLIRDLESSINAIYDDVAASYADVRASAWLHGIKTPDAAQYVNGVGPSGAPVVKGRELSGAADTVMADFMKTNMLDILDTYGRTVSRKIEHAAQLGPKGERLQQLIDSASSEGVPKPDLEAAVELVNSTLGLKPVHINSKLKAGMDFIHAWTYLALLSKASISSLMEPITLSIRTGQLRHTMAPLIQVARAVTRSKLGKETADLAQAIGVNGHKAVEEVLMNRLGGDYAMTPRWSNLLHRFFKANFLTPLTRAQRAYSVGAATGYLRKLAQQYKAGGKDAAGDMNELGIGDHDAFADWMLAQNGALPDPRSLFDKDGRPTPRGQDFMVAVRRIVDQSIQNPSAAHRPAWTNNPAGRLVTGIMSFSYASYENIIKGTIKRVARSDNKAARAAPVALGAAALVIAQTLTSTARELLFNAARFEDKDDDEIAEEMFALGLSRTFGFGSSDPLIQYLTGLKYQRGLAEIAIGAGPGTAAKAIDTLSNLFSARNSENTETAEFRAGQQMYRTIITPAINAVLSRIPGGGVGIMELSDKKYADSFGELFGVAPEPRSRLDTKYREAVQGIDDLKDRELSRIGLLPKDQWAGELEKLKAEYPGILAGVTLDRYVTNSKYGRRGQPKQTKDGKPKLKLSRGDFGSVFGELEGYPYWDVYRKREATGKGIQDGISDMNRGIKNLATSDMTNRQLIAYVQDADPDTDIKSIPDNDAKASRSAVIAAREALMAKRRDLKRQAIDVIERGQRGEEITRRH